MLDSLSGLESFLIFGTIAFILAMPVVIFVVTYFKAKKETSET